MKRLILPALLLLASIANATITNFHWEGTVESGNIPETDISGSFSTDDSAPINPDESGPFCTTYDGGLKNISLHIGAGDYGFPVWSYIVPTNGNGTFGIANLPLSGGPLNIDDLQWGSTVGSRWELFWGHNGYDTISGKITRLWTDQPVTQMAFNDVSNDTAPTPEPSSFVLMGAALFGFGLLRWRRRGDRSIP